MSEVTSNARAGEVNPALALELIEQAAAILRALRGPFGRKAVPAVKDEANTPGRRDTAA